MRCLFVYPCLNTQIGYPHGVGMLSACLKRAGHETGLLYVTSLNPKQIVGEVLEYNPALILFSAGSNQYSYAVEIARAIKSSCDIPLAIGGPHATFCPEECIEDFDIICIGEGEEAVVELANNKERAKIANLWVKNSSKTILKSSVRPFINLDTLPQPDYEILDLQRMIDAKGGWLDVIAGRGCPFHCTYCFNDSYRNIYRRDLGNRKGEYIRYKSPQKMASEIQFLSQRYSFNMVNFVDDSLVTDRLWLKEFSQLYNGVPFACNAHPNQLNSETVQYLRDGNCKYIKLGIECANEEIRQGVLGRRAKNSQIRDAIKMLKEAGIKVSTYNMIGLPTETKRDILETLKFNAELEIDVVRVFTFYPYRGTPIYQECLDRGLIREELSLPNYFEGTILDFPRELKQYIEYVEKHFDRLLTDFCKDKPFRYEKRYTKYFAERVPK